MCNERREVMLFERAGADAATIARYVPTNRPRVHLCDISLFYCIVQENELRESAGAVYGETEPGTTTVTLTRGETTIVIREVPAQICTICGEDYVDAATGKRLSQIPEILQISYKFLVIL
jgi:YgiT-type zinc finger domain-containing protein